MRTLANPTGPTSFYGRTGKRILDLVLALLALPFALIIGIPTALLIFLEDRGPVFFVSQRRGVAGEPFKIYKFRSMVVNAPDLRNADNSTVTSASDARVTRVGRMLRKTSIDELPQLINVLLGDMSLVGPRPNMATTPYHLLTHIERERVEISPGLTGYSQANFRNSIPAAEKYQHDVWYKDNLSLRLDVTILVTTILNVVRQKNIN